MASPEKSDPGRAGDRTREAGERAAGAARDTAETARRQAEHQAEGQMSEAANSLHQTAERLHKAAEDLSAQEGWLKTALHRAADSCDGASDYLSGRRLGQVAEDARHMARRNPAAFLGGAAALGFVLARIGRSTVEEGARMAGQPPAGPDGDRSARGYHGGRPAPQAAPVYPETLS